MDAPKLFDCFPFFNELDLLELRLRELDGVVDHFVLVEARETFAGKPKPLHFEANAARFAPWADKITHIVVDHFPPRRSKWSNEHVQRAALQAGIAQAAPQDLVMLSDLDEIVKPEVLAGLKAQPPSKGEVLCFELRFFQFYLNLENPQQKWLRIGPRLARRDTVRNIRMLRQIRAREGGGPRDWLRLARASWVMRRIISRRIISDAGLHFSWLGGAAAVAEKFSAIPDQVGLSGEIDETRAKAFIRGNVDFSPHLQVMQIDESFPRAVRDNTQQLAHLIYSDPKGTGWEGRR